MASQAKKILIVGPSWVGDMVMAQSLFMALKQQQPQCSIDVLAPAWSLPVLQRMPEVSRGIAMPVGHGKLALGMRYQLGKSLQAEGYDQAILLPNSLKSALVPFFADIPVRTGWRGEMRYGLLNDIRLLNKDRYPLMVQRFVALAYRPGETLPNTLPQPRLLIQPANVDSLLTTYQIDKNRPLLALCPGAEFGPAKRWPESHYAAVAKYYLDRGWQLALLGSRNDQAVAQAIIAQCAAEKNTRCINLAGQTELAAAIDLLSCASAVVSNDSGLMHIAAALNRPLVVVYGSTSPKFTPPLSDCVSIEQLDVDCGPCFQRQCPLPETQGRMQCLQALQPERVILSIDRLMTTQPHENSV